MIDETYLTQTLRDLVAINSANPDLSQDGAGELAIARYTAAAMQALGMQAQVDEPAPGRANAVGLLRGAGGGKRLMWNAHMDTVGINGMPQPFEACVRDGRLYGRGAQDMKGSLAAMLAAVKALRDQGVTLKGDLLLTGVADEEYASLGTQDIVRRYQADAAIVTEPTEMIISRAHRGFIGFELEFFGRAAHGSRYQEGIDAILMLGRFLNELAGLEAELRARTPHPLVGPPSLHTSLVRGGTEMSTYPAHCYLMIERRTVPGETVESAQAELQAILDRLAAQDAAFKATLKVFLARSPFEIDASAEIVQALSAALGETLGRVPDQGGVSFWTDAALLADAGIPTVLLGPVGHGLHSAEEWVDLASCVQLAETLVRTARRYCA